jgi:hypothetical protein
VVSYLSDTSDCECEAVQDGRDDHGDDDDLILGVAFALAYFFGMYFWR